MPRRFSGEYDVYSQQIYTDGDINFDSIYRYKGFGQAGVGGKFGLHVAWGVQGES